MIGNLCKYIIQGCQKRWSIDIPHRKSRAIHILLCERMGPFVYFYLKIEAYSFTGEPEKGGYSDGTSLLCHMPENKTITLLEWYCSKSRIANNMDKHVREHVVYVLMGNGIAQSFSLRVLG